MTHTTREGKWDPKFGMQDLFYTTERVLAEEQSVEQHTKRPHLKLWTLISTTNNETSDKRIQQMAFRKTKYSLVCSWLCYCCLTVYCTYSSYFSHLKTNENSFSNLDRLILKIQSIKHEMFNLELNWSYIRISLEHLWGAVLQSTTEIVKELLRTHHGSRAKVNESDVETFIDDDVFILDVSVKDVLCSQIENRSHQLWRDGRPHFSTNVSLRHSFVACFLLGTLHWRRTCLKM